MGIILFILLIIASIQDYFQSKISNCIIITGYIVSLICHGIILGTGGIYFWLKGLLIPIALLFVLFYFKMLGAGDIKLLSVTGSFIGSEKVCIVMCIAFLLAAVIAAGKLLYYRNLKERFVYFWIYIRRLLRQKRYLPYMDMKNKDKSFTIHFSIPVLLAAVVVYMN